MPIYFIDSSALVKRYQHEEGSRRVNQLLDSSERIIVARRTQLEVSASIVRRGRATGLSPQALSTALAVFDRDLIQSFEIVELDLPVFERAVEMTRKHGLRAADAIQLACALFAGDEIPPRELTVVGSDHELNTAAAAEGLAVLDPTHP